MNSVGYRHLVHVDRQRTVDLTGIGHTDHDVYVITENTDGTLLFTRTAL